MKNLLMFLFISFMLSSCATMTESIHLNESRSDQLARHGYSTSKTCTVLAKNVSDSTIQVTINKNKYNVSAGDAIEFELIAGYYKVDTEKYVFTQVDKLLGYDIEFMPAYKYKTKLK
jgi:co-chaperonin GroES (HSP10)